MRIGKNVMKETSLSWYPGAWGFYINSVNRVHVWCGRRLRFRG